MKGLKRKDFHQAHQTATQREAEMRREQRNEHMHLESLRTMTNTHISETLSGVVCCCCFVEYKALLLLVLLLLFFGIHSVVVVVVVVVFVGVVVVL